MKEFVSSEPSKSAAVTSIGTITLLLGGAYALLGGSLLLAVIQEPAPQERKGGWNVGPELRAGFVAVATLIGITHVSAGFLGLFAGTGTLLRKRWGWLLTFPVAALSLLLGLVWATGRDPNAISVALGAGQILYGVLAVIVLIRRRAEFDRPRRRTSGGDDATAPSP